MPAQRRVGFTLLELLVVIAIIAMLLGLLLPALGAARRSAQQVQNATNIRSIHSAMVLFAGENAGFYPGLPGAKGLVLAHTQIPDSNMGDGGSPRGRLALMLHNNLIQAGIIVSPLEVKQAWAPGTPISTDHFSYGMLHISLAADNDRRQDEWQQTSNQEAAVIADRNTSAGGVFGDATAPTSIHNKVPGEWRGNVGWNDNHVTFELTHLLDTVYRDSHNSDDNLFDPSAPAAGSSPSADGNAAIQYN